MKKQIRYIASLVILLGVVGVIGATTTVFADIEDEGGVPRCNCQIVNGGENVYGRVIGDDCIPNPCWIPV